jgi:hypothetical protein
MASSTAAKDPSTADNTTDFQDLMTMLGNYQHLVRNLLDKGSSVTTMKEQYYVILTQEFAFASL